MMATTTTPTPPKVLRKSQQAAALGVSRYTIIRLQANDPTYPVEREFSPGIVGVLAEEFDAWLQSRPKVGKKKRVAQKSQ